MAEHRLGDIIDDHCSKCSMLTNHSIVSVVDDEIARVRCRTCYYEHKYRHGKGGKKKLRQAVKCDLCSGRADMACIYNCPCGAIERIDPNILLESQ